MDGVGLDVGAPQHLKGLMTTFSDWRGIQTMLNECHIFPRGGDVLCANKNETLTFFHPMLCSYVHWCSQS